ncbi:hypothetical protein GCM10010121_094560 [Streptomyces brasiliensis]|uniref:Peptidase M48 domain-containing protein n=1 Tax=Streptomyces brasiliensis TaxID=1954 RepID=A0A917PAS1_9ACTN|nr:hypothetical protein GCM10010121_094560 [Streptomyces brasiliensis]
MSGSRGRIPVTAAMLGALDPTERRVLLAHGRAHLIHRHALVCTAMTLAVAANPVPGHVRTTVAFLVERWADEQAATAVGERTVTARALARAALLAHRARPTGAARLGGRVARTRCGSRRKARASSRSTSRLKSSLFLTA